MSIVTYRGVKYDTDSRSNRELVKTNVREVYRGIKHDEKVEVQK